jgi:hypothetical protein
LHPFADAKLLVAVSRAAGRDATEAKQRGFRPSLPNVMTPHEFIRKWKPVALTERQTAQEHFLDLCRLVGHPTPVEEDLQVKTIASRKAR